MISKMSKRGSNGRFINMGFAGIPWALVFLTASSSFAQQPNQPIYIEGTVQKADGAPLARVPVAFSNGLSVLTNSSGHYFAVLPSGFTGSSAATRQDIDFSPFNHSYKNLVSDQIAQDFTGGTNTVSGEVGTTIVPLPGVAFYFDGYSKGIVSGGDGSFSLSIPQGYSGAMVPMMTGFTFSPGLDSYPGQSPHVFGNAGYSSNSAFTSISYSSQASCYYTDSNYLFPPTTSAIFVRTLGYIGNSVTFSWYDPSGVLRRQTSTDSAPCAVSSINVAGTDVAQSRGVWRVDFQWSGPSAFPGSSGSIPFAVLPPDQPVTAPPSLGSMADLASGAGWDTTIQLVNTGGASAQTSIGFFADDGSALPLPVLPGMPTSGVIDSVAPHATLLIDSSNSDTLQTGYAQLTSDSGIKGFIRFRYAPRDQEAIVPLETRNASSYVLAFDNTNGIATGAAIANLTGASASIAVLIRNNNGAQIGSGTISLAANGHASFVLSDRFASTANQTGTIEFDTPALGQISVLGLRFPPSGRFTTIPVIANTDPGGGLMAHLAVGDGWTSTIELVNSGPQFAQAHLKFFNDNGTPLSLPWTLAGSPITASGLDQTLAPHSRVVVAGNPADGDPLQVGSAQLTTDGYVSGFIRFRYGPRDQEAIVPIEARNASSYILPFDNTNGLAAGVAVSGNLSGPTIIPALIRDTTGARVGVGTISLPAGGHSAFVLSDQFPITANVSGTVEFGTPTGGQISVLGFRFPASGAFSTIPVLAP